MCRLNRLTCSVLNICSLCRISENSYLSKGYNFKSICSFYYFVNWTYHDFSSNCATVYLLKLCSIFWIFVILKTSHFAFVDSGLCNGEQCFLQVLMYAKLVKKLPSLMKSKAFLFNRRVHVTAYFVSVAWRVHDNNQPARVQSGCECI
jgi:hypothetical protein